MTYKGYKGFNKDLVCRKGETNEKQYAIGETYEESTADLCNSGLHWCEYPLDCFGYYAPSDGRFAEIEAHDVDKKTGEDSKRVSKKITVKAELSIIELVKASVDWVYSKIEDKAKKEVTGYQSAATNTGDYSAATNTGHQSAATNTGYRSAATNTGHRSAATVEGKESIAVAWGIEGKAKASLGSWITLAEWEEADDIWRIKTARIAQIDGEILKADTFYTLKNGEFVEAEEYPA